MMHQQMHLQTFQVTQQLLWWKGGLPVAVVRAMYPEGARPPPNWIPCCQTEGVEAGGESASSGTPTATNDSRNGPTEEGHQSQAVIRTGGNSTASQATIIQGSSGCVDSADAGKTGN